LYSAGSTSALLCIALGNICFDQTRNLPFLVVPHFAMLAAVNHACNVWYGDPGLGNVGGCLSVSLKNRTHR
jgi:hypothetical protein